MQDTLSLCAKKFLVKLNREISSGEICKKASEIGAAFFSKGYGIIYIVWQINGHSLKFMVIRVTPIDT